MAAHSEQQQQAARGIVEQRIADSIATWHGLYNAETRPLSVYLYEQLADLFVTPEPEPELQAIGARIRTQDNRCTDQPMFVVLEKREIVTREGYDHDRIVWFETKSGDYNEASEVQVRRLEALRMGGRETPGWERIAVKEIDMFVTTCFTEQGCRDFLARDGHNHRKPFIYAYGSYRNAEYQAVRNFLAALPAPEVAP